MAAIREPGPEVIFRPKPSRPPPPATVGAIGWLRQNLFYSWFSALLTFGGLYVLYVICASLYETPALTKNEMRPTTFSKSSGSTCPESRTVSRTAIAVHSA